MRTRFLILLAALAVVFPSCTSLNRGDSFNKTIDGIEYNFEVIVSKMVYLRVSPVSGPADVAGDIDIPSSVAHGGVKYVVTQIGERAFKDYKGIISVHLPATLSQIEKEAFAGCTSLQSVATPQPLSVIGDYAFDGCRALKEFSLEASISELGTGAFRGCSSLSELVFTPTFSEIPDELCSGCTSLSEIILPSTVMSVGAGAFENCVSAVTLKADRSLQSVGAYAFAGCSSLEAIECMTATPPACSADSFDGISTVIPVTVPMASVADYQRANGWNRFSNIVGKY